MRRSECGAGRTMRAEIRPHRSGGRRGAIPRLVRCGARARASQARTRAAAGLRPEALRPPARSWLTSVGTLCATGESAARRRSENAAMERRKARRAARHVHTQDVAPTGAPSPLLRADALRRASPASAKSGYSGLARRSFSEGGRRSVGFSLAPRSGERESTPVPF